MYNKLFTKILDSSIWLEPHHVRIVWFTFIAAMDEDGFAQFAAIGNLANRARVTLDEAKEAVSILEAPDPSSSDPGHEGRRIERVPGGWMVLNAPKYRELVTKVIAKERVRSRVAAHRARKETQRDVTLCNATVTPSNVLVTPSEAEAEAEAEAKKTPIVPKGDGGQVALDSDSPKKKKAVAIPDLPEDLKTPEVLKAWEEWQTHQKQIKNPMTALRAEKVFKSIKEKGAVAFVAAVDHSIASGYMGLVSPKATEGGKAAPAQGRKEPTVWELTRVKENLEEELCELSNKMNSDRHNKQLQAEHERIRARIAEISKKMKELPL